MPGVPTGLRGYGKASGGMADMRTSAVPLGQKGPRDL
jgi:hypothetical protein